MSIISLDLGWANLVVEKYEDDEFSIFLQDKATNCITQDIVAVRQSPSGGEVIECLVWGDEDSEDYTYKFLIAKYEGK